MVAKAEGMSSIRSAKYPGPGWDPVALVGAHSDTHQRVWRQDFPGSVEWRVRLEPVTLGTILVEWTVFALGATIGISFAAYSSADDLAQAGPFILAFLLGSLPLILIRGITVLVMPWRPMVRIRASDSSFRMDVPTATFWSKHLFTEPKALVSLRICRSPWRRQDIEGVIRSWGRRWELRIEQHGGAVFTLAGLHAATVEAVAREISEFTGTPIERW